MAVATATDSGTVVEVYTTTLGDELAAAASAGATTLSVKDAVDFDDAGGWLTIGTETIYYDTAVDDEDNDVGVLTLSTPLANAYAEAERVTLDPPSFEKFALVMVGDFGEAVEAVVPHTLWDRIGDGIRPDGEGEVVTLSLVGSTFEVTDVVGSEPVIDGSYLDPEIPLDPAIVPAPPPPPASDGLAPTVVPTPEVFGAFGALAVRWDPLEIPADNADTVTYDVHISTTSSVAGDATTQVAAGLSGSPVFIRALPAGTALVPDVDYWVALRSVDRDGPGPLSVAVGPRQLAKAGDGDVVLTAEMMVANHVLAEAIEAEDLTGRTITGPLIRTSASGNRLELTNLDEVRFFSGVTGETQYGILFTRVSGGQGAIRLDSPRFTASANDAAYLDLLSSNASGTARPAAHLNAGHGSVILTGDEIEMWDKNAGTRVLYLEALTGLVLDNGYSLKAEVGGFSVSGSSNGSVGTGTFRDSVDARVSAVAPTVTMTSGAVGTGAFRDSVDARADARIAAGTPGVWTAYTPTFTAGTTNPTLANFTRTGRYLQVGKRVDFVIVITCNTAAGLGSGTYEFGLPVAARDATEVVGQGMQSTPNQPYVVRGISTTAISAYLTDTRAGMNSTNSVMAVGTIVRISGTYEAA